MPAIPVEPPPSDFDFYRPSGGYGTAGRDLLIGGVQADWFITGEGADFIDASDGNDVANGGGGNDTIIAGGGNDLLVGENGNDWLEGGSGVDRVYAGGGSDTLSGGAGDGDLLYGGSGSDTFVFRPGDGNDVVADMITGYRDRPDLTDAPSVRDRIDLTEFSPFLGSVDTFEELRDSGRITGTSGSNPETVIRLSATDVLTLRGVDPAKLTAANFVFEPFSGEHPSVLLSDIANGEGGYKVTVQEAGAIDFFQLGDDINGDGIRDYLIGVGSDGTTSDGNRPGAVYVAFGSGEQQTISLADLAAGNGGYKIIGEPGDNLTGQEVSSLGDVNGDGFADLLVSAVINSSNGSERNGASYVVYGKADGGNIELADVATGTGGFKIVGEGNFDAIGNTLATTDFNGDGRPDYLIGTFGYTTSSQTTGAAYIVYGGENTGTIDLDDVAAGTGGIKIIGEGRPSFNIQPAGDVNGDGLQDVIVGNPTYSVPDKEFTGAAYVVFGRSGDGNVDLKDVAAGIGGFKITGENQDDLSGGAVGSAGDVNGDGLADLYVGSNHRTSDGYSGADYIVFGKADGTEVDLKAVENGNGGFVIVGEGQEDAVAVADSIGDINGDGRDDLLVASSDGVTGSDYVVFGKSDGSPLSLADAAAGRNGFKILGDTETDQARGGYDIGDVNGDGLTDLFVAGIAGSGYVVYGTPEWGV